MERRYGAPTLGAKSLASQRQEYTEEPMRVGQIETAVNRLRALAEGMRDLLGQTENYIIPILRAPAPPLNTPGQEEKKSFEEVPCPLAGELAIIADSMEASINYLCEIKNRVEL